MRFRGMTRRLWTSIIALPVIYAGLGYWLAEDDVVEAWLFRIGLTAAAFIPLIFVGIYTWFGLHSQNPGAKWWKTQLGSALVLAALSLFPITAPLAWVFWFDGGMLHQSWLAWLEVSGPAVSALAWLRLCLIWLRVHRVAAVTSVSGRVEAVHREDLDDREPGRHEAPESYYNGESDAGEHA